MRSCSVSSAKPRRAGHHSSLLRWVAVAGALHAAFILLSFGQQLHAPGLPLRAVDSSDPVWLELIAADGAPAEEPARIVSRLPASSGSSQSPGPPGHSPPASAMAALSTPPPPTTTEGSASGAVPPAEAGELEGGPAEMGDEGPRLSLRELGIGAEHNPFTGSPPSQPTQRQALNERLNHSLRSELANHDQKLGLGPEGPAVAAVKGIVLDSATLPNTSAVLRLRTDADGLTVHVEVIEASNASDGWRRIADELKRALAGKKLRVPPGTGGVSMILRVASRVQLPSGADPGLAVELFGQTLKAGEGDKSSKISILTPKVVIQEVEIPFSNGGTMPVVGVALSIVSGSGDIGDIGAVARRVVTAYLVSMETHPSPAIAPIVP
jgi:hypothetical protein